MILLKKTITYLKKSYHALVVGELSLFKRLFVTHVACVDPLACGAIMKVNSQTNLRNFSVIN